MTVVDYETGEDFSAGNFLDEPGTYHLIVNDVESPPTKRSGEIIDNGFFSIKVQVLDGTVGGQKDKTTDLLFFYPKEEVPGKRNLNKVKIDRCFVAFCLMGEEDKGKKLSIDLNDMCGRQCVAKLEKNQKGEYLQLAFADIYHVDDPAVKDVPKCKEGLSLLPPELRRVGERPKPANKKASGNGAAKAAKSAKEKAAAVNVDDIDL